MVAGAGDLVTIDEWPKNDPGSSAKTADRPVTIPPKRVIGLDLLGLHSGAQALKSFRQKAPKRRSDEGLDSRVLVFTDPEGLSSL
jgi:hypothetical protein